MEKSAKTQKNVFILVDVLLILMMILPIVGAIVLKVLTTPASEGVSITGARIFFTIPMPLQDLPITEAQINSLLVLISIFGLCLYMTHGLKVKAESKRQRIAEWIVEKVEKMVDESMGGYFKGYPPRILITSEAKIDVINITVTTNTSRMAIEPGAQVSKVIVLGDEMTLEEFIDNYNIASSMTL